MGKSKDAKKPNPMKYFFKAVMHIAISNDRTVKISSSKATLEMYQVTITIKARTQQASLFEE